MKRKTVKRGDLIDRITSGEIPASAYCNRCNAKEVNAGLCPQCGPGEFRFVAFVPIPKEPVMAKKKTEALNVAAHFNKVSIGDAVASVGVKIDRESMTIDQAEQFLCGRRLSASVLVLPPGVDPNQKSFIKGDRHEIVGTFDVGKFAVSPKQITATLAFSLGEIEVEQLGYVAQKSGRLIVTAAEAIPEKEKKAPTDASDDDDF